MAATIAALADGLRELLYKEVNNSYAISQVGGAAGVQYTEGDTDTTITGTAVMWEDTSDTLRAASAAKPLPVNIISGGSGGTQYAEDAVHASSDLGNLALVVRKDTAAAVAADGDYIPLIVDSTGRLWVHTEVAALLPTSLGQKTKANSLAVTLASDQDTLAVSNASLPLPTGAATSAKQPALGTAGASSTDVLSVQGIASGTALPVSAASLPLPSGAATSAQIGEVQASPTSNTVLDRLKALLTGIVLSAGSALIGKVGIDQTTPGTTNAVAMISGQAGVAGGSGVTGATVQRVVLATDVALPAGTNLLGKTGIDQTTPGSTNGVQTKQYAGVPSSFAIQTSDQTVFTLAAGEIGFVQNLHTTALAVKKGASASTTSLSFILPGGTAQDDGKGGPIMIDDWVGVVSVAAMSGSPRYVAWKQAA